jgi:hypothetical protein
MQADIDYAPYGGADGTTKRYSMFGLVRYDTILYNYLPCTAVLPPGSRDLFDNPRQLRLGWRHPLVDPPDLPYSLPSCVSYTMFSVKIRFGLQLTTREATWLGSDLEFVAFLLLATRHDVVTRLVKLWLGTS